MELQCPFCPSCAAETGEEHAAECPYGRAERAERERDKNQEAALMYAGKLGTAERELDDARRALLDIADCHGYVSASIETIKLVIDLRAARESK